MLPFAAGPSPEPVKNDLASDEQHDLVEPCVQRGVVGMIPRLVDSRKEQAAASVVHEMACAVARLEEISEDERGRRPQRIAWREDESQLDLLPDVRRKLDGESRING